MRRVVAVVVSVALVGGFLALAIRGQEVKVMGIAASSPKRADKVVLTDVEWRTRLSAEQFRILRSKGTEPTFCGVDLEPKGPGIYHCVGCDLALFSAERKFNSGTGWPSYTEPVSNEAIWFKQDTTHNMVRTEVLCARCDGHLGHVFPDGPPPKGLRYCINGTVLLFRAAK